MTTRLLTLPALAAFLFAFPPLSLGATESFVCGDSPIETGGVRCCVDVGSPERCRKILDKLLKPADYAALNEVRAKIAQGEYVRTPNCHWSSLKFSGYTGRLIPTRYDSRDFGERLAEEFMRLDAKAQPRPGDIFVVAEVGGMRNPIFENGKLKKVTYVPGILAHHSGIYLGDGLIFQKEDRVTDIFSVSTVARSFKAYSAAWRYDPVWSLKDPVLEIIFYRRKAPPQ